MFADLREVVAGLDGVIAANRRATGEPLTGPALITWAGVGGVLATFGQPLNPTTALPSTNRRAAPTTIDPAVPSPAM
ncbi:MAG: hypothetical protein WAK93_12990 [Solirubrobacteraceae bacterium]